MKKMVTLREELVSMGDSDLDKCLSIRGTDYDRSVRYSAKTKKQWKMLHEAVNVQMSYSEIAEKWDTTYATVRRALDPEYAEKIRENKKKYYSEHKDTLKSTYTSESRKSRIERKRAIVDSSVLNHLKSL